MIAHDSFEAPLGLIFTARIWKFVKLFVHAIIFHVFSYYTACMHGEPQISYTT
jgi:hypothetical protein